MRNPDGSHSCDGCGADVGDGGVATSVVISDLDPRRPGQPLIRNLCRSRREAAAYVQGCADVALTPEILAHYHATRSASHG